MAFSSCWIEQASSHGRVWAETPGPRALSIMALGTAVEEVGASTFHQTKGARRKEKKKKKSVHS